MKDYPETHQQGHIFLENVPEELRNIPLHSAMEGDFSVQIAKDGRVWICIDGVAFIRFMPNRIKLCEEGEDAEER